MEEKRGGDSLLEPAPRGNEAEKTLYAPVIVANPVADLEEEKSRDNAVVDQPKTPTQKPSKKRFSWAKTAMISMLLFSFGLLGFGGYVIASKFLNAAGKTTGESAGDVLSGLFRGFTDNTTPLLGQTEGRTNFLIIGVDGSGYLADSISLVSYFYDTKEFTSIHIPRDMTVRSQFGRTKINEFFSYAEQTGDRNGPKELKDLLEEELAIKLHYWAQFNFYAVKDLVDAVGGVEVEVPNTFTDCDYPADMPGVPNGTCFKFVAGKETMDGTRALIFARSRHAYDNAAEGSDFARGKRQSIIMESLLKKMSADAKSKGGIFDARKLSTYLDVLGANVKLSIKSNELKSFYDTFYKQVGGLDNIKFTKISWDTSSGLFTSAFSTPEAYVITYYDGQMIGDGQPSKARTEARNQIQDPRAVGKNGNAKKASLIVLGNNSGKVKSVFDEVKKLGFTPCAQCYDDTYPKITPASSPKITVYVSDSTIRDEAKDLLQKATFPYTVENVLPTTRVLTPNNQGVDIVIWIE